MQPERMSQWAHRPALPAVAGSPPARHKGLTNHAEVKHSEV